MGLSQAIAGAFAAAGFSSSDLLTGQINITDLPWQCPPLVCTETLNGTPLEEYLSYPINVDGEQLFRFWQVGLAGLYAYPQSVVMPSGWRFTGRMMRSTRPGERAMRFCVPEGYPHYNPYAGHVFSLEVANLFVTSIEGVELHAGIDDYWVSTPYGECGVRNGSVIDSAEWGESIAGMVDTLLLNGRGLISTACRYDTVSKVRSLLHENESMFEDFAGLDWALQALAKISQDRLCVELMVAIENMLPNLFEIKRKVKILDEALDILETWMVNDRLKIGSMFEVLVPAVYPVNGFYSQVFHLNRKVPDALHSSGIWNAATCCRTRP